LGAGPPGSSHSLGRCVGAMPGHAPCSDPVPQYSLRNRWEAPEGYGLVFGPTIRQDVTGGLALHRTAEPLRFTEGERNLR